MSASTLSTLLVVQRRRVPWSIEILEGMDGLADGWNGTQSVTNHQPDGKKTHKKKRG